MGPDNNQITVDLDKCSLPMSLQELFGRAGPVHIEVGSGKGTFLLNQARLHPEINFLGIEWANKYYRSSVDRMRRWDVGNVRILRADARDFIRRYLGDGSVSAFHVYFPDPWPKKRHHKRRFFRRDNLLEVIRSLAPGGELHTATDHADYFEAMCRVLLHEPVTASWLEQNTFRPTDAAETGEWVGSNFERKYLKEGRKIYTLALRKITTPAFTPL